MNRLVLALVISLFAATASGGAQQSEASRKALESAAAKGSAPSQYALGAAAEADSDFSMALERYRQAADQGYAPAQLKIGELYEKGNGVEADRAQAIGWYRKASAQGFAQAIERLQALDPTAAASPTATAPTTEPLTPTTPPAEHPQASPGATEQARPTTSTDQASAPVASAPSPAPVASPGVMFRMLDGVLGSVGLEYHDQPTPTGKGNDVMLRYFPHRNPDDAFDALILLYVVPSTLLGWLMMRPIIMRWFRGSSWFVTGRDVRDVFFNTIKMRVQVEGLALTLGLFVGCLGGNLWFILSRVVRLARRKEPTADDAELA